MHIRYPVRLGVHGPTVPGMGLGCMGLTSFYGNDTAAADPKEVISRALDLGIPFVDTADAYGPYTNEIEVGAALKGRREQFVLATKFGVVRRDNDSKAATGSICGRAEYVRQSCEKSLKRLGTDHLDLYYMHRPDPHTPIEETTDALARLVAEGKVRYIGFCEIGPSLVKRAHAVHPVCGVQSEYSLWHRDTEDLLPTLRELGIGLVAYSPLGRGFLSGKIRSPDDLASDDWRRQSPRFQGENFARNLQVLDEVKRLAHANAITSAQLALAWIIAQGAVPLNGATSIEQLEENVRALDVQLSPHDLAAIEAVSPKGAFSGASWPAGSVGEKVDTT
jgi:aryl-alcohol dehydrogenase-like predicted oxidoreductase